MSSMQSSVNVEQVLSQYEYMDTTSKNKPIIPLSSCEVEYVAACQSHQIEMFLEEL